MRCTLPPAAFERAALIKGGYEQLARSLNVSVPLLHAWRDGSLPVPGEMFLRIVDVLAADDLDPVTGLPQTTSATHKVVDEKIDEEAPPSP